MAADGHRTRAAQACLTCKTRKKKCDKRVPSCSYCLLKDLGCHYTPAPRRRVYATPTTDGSSNPAGHHERLTLESIDAVTPQERITHNASTRRTTLYRPHFEGLDGIHLEVQNIIRSTGEFVDDLTARYFRNFHGHLPIIYRPRFQDNLLTTGPPPGADTSVLLLNVCLLAYLPNPDRLSGDGDNIFMGRESLYLAAKTLLAQVQGCLPPSIPLIQATLLLAVYEYANGRPEVALVTVAACARMAYGARIHNRRHLLHKASRLEVEEAANTWWGIVLCERVFLSEVDDLEQPMATTLPPGDSQLPVGREVLDRGEIINSGSIPNIPVSCVATAGIGGFGRAAQACCLLDQVLRGLVISDVNTKLPLLESLDRTIQSFLSLLLTRTEHKVLPYCTALAVTVRTLFTLHTHILNIPHQVTHANLRTLDEWKKGSLAALDTATTMAIDMAHCHRADLPADGTNNTSPIHIYVVSAAIRHMRTRLRTGNRDTPWPESAEDELGSYLRRLQNQWVA